MIVIAAQALFAYIGAPVVDTDKWPNTHSVETMVADVTTPGMSDEEKVIALWKLHRRLMYHFEMRGETGRVQNDITCLYHTYGYSYCTQAACVFRALMRGAFSRDDTRGLTATVPVIGGHSTFEVRYGGTWHWIDPIIGAFARTSAGGPLAGIDEIAANPNILLNAEAEGRASSPYFPCTHGTDPG